MNGEGYVGSPASHYLRQFGIVVYEAFGDFPYLVGSAVVRPDWRDVDVRLILADEEYERQIGEVTQPRYENLRWNALCVAFSALGAQMTGLPIDFQIDQQTWANEHHSKPRSALGVGIQIARDQSPLTSRQRRITRSSRTS